MLQGLKKCAGLSVQSIVSQSDFYHKVVDMKATWGAFRAGDDRTTLSAGLIEYYYKEVDTWHTTHPSGVEVFYFSTGQTEAHHPSGMKEIIFPGEA